MDNNNKTDNKNKMFTDYNIFPGKVRLIMEDGKAIEIDRDAAIDMAKCAGKNLVQIAYNKNSFPKVVCKIIDYGKYLYEQKKRDKMLKAKSTQIVVKEVRFGPQTDEHDYEFKKKNAEKFLKEGSKLKAFVFFKGRSIIYKEQGQILLLRLAQDLEEFGKVEAMPVLEGKRMIMYIAPKKKK